MTPGSVPTADGARTDRPVPSAPAAPADRATRDTIHVPVFADRITDLLRPAFDAVPDPVYVDATLGMGGHTLLMLAASPGLRVIGIDRDPAALQIAGERIAAAGHTDRVELVHAVNDQVGPVIAARARNGVQGILFDLGGVLAATGPGGSRIRLFRRRPAGHADGSDHGHLRRGRAQYLCPW